jgi:hypothetical protein
MVNFPIKPPLFFGAGLLIIKSFINRLVNLFKITQQDLIDAGVYHRH